jgi:hypothetical protein
MPGTRPARRALLYTLMVRSASSRVSNMKPVAILRDARKRALLRMRSEIYSQPLRMRPYPSCRDFTIIAAQAFLREKNALNAATASMERIRSPNKWLS